MNICHAYGPPLPDDQAERLLLAALDDGVTHFDTAALYGFGASERTVGRVLSRHRSRFTLASKCGMQGVDVKGDGQLVRVIDGTSTTCTAGTSRCPSKRAWVGWPTWCVPARFAASA